MNKPARGGMAEAAGPGPASALTPGAPTVAASVSPTGQAPASTTDAAASAAPCILTLGRHGWLRPSPGVRLAPSPNQDARPESEDPYLLVLHNISLPPGVFGGPEVEGLFLNRLDYDSHPWLPRLRGLRVSAHFFVRRDGSVIQFVASMRRAWHAGVSSFEGRERCNDFSLGIELEGTDFEPYTDAQYATLAGLTKALRARHPLRAAWGHEHIAPGRKTDPGPYFDWARYGRENGWLRRQMPPGVG